MNEYKEMNLKEAEHMLGNAVYEACLIYERLEGAQKLHGNGHHMAQEIAAKACELLRKSWIADA